MGFKYDLEPTVEGMAYNQSNWNSILWLKIFGRDMKVKVNLYADDSNIVPSSSKLTILKSIISKCEVSIKGWLSTDRGKLFIKQIGKLNYKVPYESDEDLNKISERIISTVFISKITDYSKGLIVVEAGVPVSDTSSRGIELAWRNGRLDLNFNGEYS